MNSKPSLFKALFLLTFLLLFIFKTEKAVSQANNNLSDSASVFACLDSLISVDNDEDIHAEIDKLIQISRNSACIQCLLECYIKSGMLYEKEKQFGKALEDFKYAVHLSDSAGIPSLQMKSNNRAGNILERMGQPEKALVYLEKARALATKLQDSTSYLEIMLGSASAQRRLQMYDQTIELYFHLLDYIKHDTNNKVLPKIYNGLAINYLELRQKEKARDHFLKALHYAYLDKNPIYFRTILFSNLSNLYLKNFEMTDSAIYYGRMAVQSAEKENNPFIGAFVNLGNVFEENGDMDSALFYYKKAEKLPSMQFLNMERAAVQINIGYILYREKNYPQALGYLNKGIIAARESGNKLFELIAQQTLFHIDSITGNYLSAIARQQEMARLNDSIQNQKTIDRVNELTIAYETDLIEKERDALLQQTTLNERIIANQEYVMWLSGLVSVLLLLIVLLFQRHKKRLRKINNELEQKNQILLEQKKSLQDLNNTKDKFFSIIAHDLRSPFNILVGYLDLLDKEFDDFSADELKAIIKKLKGASNNTLYLLENLLEWARSQRGLIKHTPMEINLKDLAKEVLELLKNRAYAKNIDIQLDIEESCIVTADHHMTYTIFLNLINNAIKFTQKGGQIKIYCTKQKDALKVCVEDNGIGIPKEQQAGLMSLSNTYTTKGTENEKGTGLGLIMCRDFISIMGGKLEFTSEPGKGSCFCFSLGLTKK